MTVKELKEKLNEFPEDADVWLFDLDSSFGMEISSVEKHPEELIILINGK